MKGEAEVKELNEFHRQFKERWDDPEQRGLRRLLFALLEEEPGPLPESEAAPAADSEPDELAESDAAAEDARGDGVVATGAASHPCHSAGLQPVAAGEGRLVKALEDVLRRRRRRVLREVVGGIKTATAGLAQRHRSKVTWLSLPLGADRLKPIVVQASAGGPRCEVRLNDPGIVSRVGRTRLPYATGDVRDDPFYKECAANMVSEQAAAVVGGEDDGGALLAVINQESHRFAHFHPASAELLRQRAQAVLTPLLREREALKAHESSPCMWRPAGSAWGLGQYMTGLLEDVKEKLEARGALERGRNDLHISVWYADLDDRVLTWFASTGFSNGVPQYEVVEFDRAGVLGRMPTAEGFATATWRPDGGDEHLNPSVHDAMGTLGSRLVVTPILSAPGGVAPFRVVVQVDAFTPEADTLLPDDTAMQRIAQVVHGQVKGYLALYPRRAADEVRLAVHESRSFTDQWQAVATTIESVLRAEAVTLYARPWQDEEHLHVIAATAPLRRRDGKAPPPLDPETRPVRSLVRSPLKVGDKASYAGVLADRPGAVVHRVSRRHSGKRLEDRGFPPSASAELSASLARTAGADRRSLGYSLTNKRAGGKAAAVAVAVRSTDRAPFKAWDAAALVAMLDAAAPVIRSWRDWAAVRLPEAQRIASETQDLARTWCQRLVGAIRRDDFATKDDYHEFHESMGDAGQNALEQDIFHAMFDGRLARSDAGPHRQQDPIPRSGSLKALSREIAADAHGRARVENGGSRPVVQAAVLMEARGDGRSVMYQVAYYHEYLNRPPRLGDPDDPRQLRVPGLDEDWCRFLDEGSGREFQAAAPGGGEVSAGVRVPFLAWIGRHAARGVLTVDLRDGKATSRGFRDDLARLARRLAAGWTASGTTLPRGRFVPMAGPEQFARDLRTHLGADALGLHLGDASSSLGPWLAPRRGVAVEPPPGAECDWRVPIIPFDRTGRSGEVRPDPDAELWGVRETGDAREVALRIPLYFGTVLAGHVVARWTGIASERYRVDPQTTRALWVRDVVTAWMLWSWDWSGGRDGSLVSVGVEESGGVWKAVLHFRKPVLAQSCDPQVTQT